jgi:phage-related protein
MVLDVFNPPVDPAPGLKVQPRFRVLKASFGDGYQQTTRKAASQRLTMDLSWPVLSLAEESAIGAFLVDHYVEPFVYALPGDAQARTWTVTSYEGRDIGSGYRSATATIGQSVEAVADAA